jgi:hypothetical protein
MASSSSNNVNDRANLEAKLRQPIVGTRDDVARLVHAFNHEINRQVKQGSGGKRRLQLKCSSDEQCPFTYTAGYHTDGAWYPSETNRLLHTCQAGGRQRNTATKHLNLSLTASEFVPTALARRLPGGNSAAFIKHLQKASSVTLKRGQAHNAMQTAKNNTSTVQRKLAGFRLLPSTVVALKTSDPTGAYEYNVEKDATGADVIDDDGDKIFRSWKMAPAFCQHVWQTDGTMASMYTDVCLTDDPLAMNLFTASQLTANNNIQLSAAALYSGENVRDNWEDFMRWLTPLFPPSRKPNGKAILMCDKPNGLYTESCQEFTKQAGAWWCLLYVYWSLPLTESFPAVSTTINPTIQLIPRV